MNTQISRTTKTGSLINICLPLGGGGGGGGKKPVCHDRYKIVAEFILILYDQMWMKIT